MVLKENHWLRESYQEAVKETVKDIKRLRDVDQCCRAISVNLSSLTVQVLQELKWGKALQKLIYMHRMILYDDILKEIVGVEIRGKDHLLELMQDFAHAKAEYDQVADALKMVKQTGYGIAAPSLADMSLDEPEIIRQGARFGVRLKAVAPSIHMIKVDVEI